MSDISQTVIREPGAESAEQYSERVHRLALAYFVLFVGSVVGIGLIIRYAQHFVTLAQRSNVETLTLAFAFVFFAYVGVLSARGALGAVRIAGYSLRVRLGGDRDSVDRQIVNALGPCKDNPVSGALNMVVEREDRAGEPFQLPIADQVGSIGVIDIRGAEIRFTRNIRGRSNSLLAYFIHQISSVLRDRGVQADMDVVQWRQIDDEATLEYLALVRFAQNLEQQLGASELWPKVVLTDEDCAELERRLSAVCHALRYEGFLPDWEYAAEHKVPLIPEPLGLVSLVREERRADPAASMGCAVLIVLAAVAVLMLFVVFPPWVPGV